MRLTLRAKLRSAVAVGILALAGTVAAGSPASAASPAPGVVTVRRCTEVALRAAINTAPSGGTVRFGCDGTILLTPAGGGGIEIQKDLTITGQGHQVTIDGGNATQLFFHGFALTRFTVEHLTLAHGNPQDQRGGGAIYNAGELIVDDVRFVENRAFEFGGAIYTFGPFGRLSVSNSTFVRNTVTCTLIGQGGGAIAQHATPPTTITHSTFEDNTATGALGVFSLFGGGAVVAAEAGYNVLGPVTISDSTFRGNQAILPNALTGFGVLQGGGAVAAFDRDLTITGSSFENNIARTGLGQIFGGAVLFTPGQRVADAISRGDDTPAHSAVIDASAFAGNTAASELSDPIHPSFGIGGALANSFYPVTVSRSAFFGNTAFSGGAIWSRSPLRLIASNLEHNTALGLGAAGGLAAVDIARVRGTTLRYNTPVSCNRGTDGRIVDLGGNIEVPGNSCGFS